MLLYIKSFILASNFEFWTRHMIDKSSNPPNNTGLN